MNMSPERRPSVQDMADANKLNYLVDRGDVAAAEVSEASAEDIETMLEQFGKKYWQEMNTLAMREKLPGQRAEDVIIEHLNHPPLHARHASAEEDQRDKIDIVITVDGAEDTPINVQMTTIDESKLIRGKQLGAEARDIVFVVAPRAAQVLDAQERHNVRELQTYAADVFRQVLQTISRQRKYAGLFQRLQVEMGIAAS